MKIKITEEGQPCRHCGTPVQKQIHKSNWKPKPGQPFYFRYWFRCPQCHAYYMVEDAKVWCIPKPPKPQKNVDRQFIERLAREE